MTKLFIPKKRIENQQYDSYWKLTVEYTDIFDTRFNNTLKMIVKYIDDNNLLTEDYKSENYQELQEIIYKVYPKADKASTRKSINQFVKLGFIKPFLKGYHPLTKKFLNTSDKDLKKSLFSTIFYEDATFCSAITVDETGKKETNFLLKTLSYHPEKKLSKEDIIALMVTPGINEISKGYLTKDELEEQYNFSKAIQFEDKKYNQIDYLIVFLNLMPNISADKVYGISFINPDEVEIDTNRDPILYGIYRSDLKKESKRLFGKEICYVEHKEYKGLTCSHIKDSAICLKEGKIEEAYDYNNGLLLSPNVDAYFDKYDISFEDDGSILINTNKITDQNILDELSKYKLSNVLLTQERLYYLKWHRDKFYEKFNK